MGEGDSEPSDATVRRGRTGSLEGIVTPIGEIRRQPDTIDLVGDGLEPDIPGEGTLDTLGRFKIESELGRGTMGVVYLGHDPRLDRPVALKACTIPDGLDEAARKVFRQRFVREARAAAGLSHPAIVTVYDVEIDRASGTPFIAMELVPGTTLADALTGDRPLPVERAVEIACTLADALHDAHAQGIVHRDVKPANVLLRESDGAAKLADFGVARLDVSSLTAAGSVIGSPGYMAPEQFAAGPIDGRADLFALAALLYEMLCGERPFKGEGLTALAHAIAREPHRPIRERAPHLPPALDAFFDRALAKDRERRFPDGRAFRDALEAASRDGAPPETVGPARTADATTPLATRVLPKRLVALSRRRPLGVALLAVVLAFAGWSVLRTEPVTVKLDGKNLLTSGVLTIEVDDAVVYTRDLAAPRPEGVLRKLVGGRSESFEAWLELRSGKREITARVVETEARAEQRETIVVELARDREPRVLELVVGRRIGSPVSLELE